MSSIFRQLSQIDNSVKYLLAVNTTTTYTLNSGATVTTLMPDATFLASTTTSTKTTGTQFRDMGKFVMTYDTRQRHLALYRLVQPMQGYTTEGVPPSYSTEKFYIRVWAADDSILPITVGRVG
jgi:hypothetical protein